MPEEEPSMDVPAPIIDEAEVLALVDGDRELLAEMARLFVTDCAALLAQVRRAVVQRDRLALEHAAHTLKGSVGTFAAKAAYQAADRIETLCSTGALADVDAAYQVLEREIARLRPLLEKLAISDPS